MILYLSCGQNFTQNSVQNFLFLYYTSHNFFNISAEEINTTAPKTNNTLQSNNTYTVGAQTENSVEIQTIHPKIYVAGTSATLRWNITFRPEKVEPPRMRSSFLKYTSKNGTDVNMATDLEIFDNPLPEKLTFDVKLTSVVVTIKNLRVGENHTFTVVAIDQIRGTSLGKGEVTINVYVKNVKSMSKFHFVVGYAIGQLTHQYNVYLTSP